VDYSLVEQVVLALSGVGLDAYHFARERPRVFWTTWAAVFSFMAVVLLRPTAARARAKRDG
jgi:hypothetical protein